MNKNKRVIVLPVLLGGALTGLLAWRLWIQDAALRAPAGGSGVVEGTEVSLATRLTTRVASLAVREGQEVRAGDLLVEMDCRDTQAMLAEAEARIEAARAQVEAARAAAGAASDAARAALKAAEAARAQAEAAERQASRVAAVSEDVSAAQVDQAQAAAAGYANQAAAARLSGRATRRKGDAAEAQAEAAAKSLAAAEAALTRARLLAEECEVKAPIDGIVELLPYEPGELVLPGSEVARVVDISTVRAIFYLPNADLAAARPGGAATVRADAWPDEAFHGRVATVATTAEFTPRNIQTRTDRDRLVYRVEVEVDNPDGRLRPGMPVEVSLDGGGEG